MILIFSRRAPGRAAHGAAQVGGRGRTRRRAQRGAGARRSSGTPCGAYAASRQGARRLRPGRQKRRGGHSSALDKNLRAQAQKENTGKPPPRCFLCIVLVLGLAFGGIYRYVGSIIFNTGEMGSLAPPESGDALVPDEPSGTMNILSSWASITALRTPSNATPSARRI